MAHQLTWRNCHVSHFTPSKGKTIITSNRLPAIYSHWILSSTEQWQSFRVKCYTSKKKIITLFWLVVGVFNVPSQTQVCSLGSFSGYCVGLLKVSLDSIPSQTSASIKIIWRFKVAMYYARSLLVVSLQLGFLTLFGLLSIFLLQHNQ